MKQHARRPDRLLRPACQDPFTLPVCQHLLNLILLHIHPSSRQKHKITPFQIDFNLSK